MTCQYINPLIYGISETTIRIYLTGTPYGSSIPAVRLIAARVKLSVLCHDKDMLGYFII